MKTYFLLFFAGALLSGCSTNYNYPSKKITVRKISGVEKDYGLLSVRGDSALAVLDWSESQVTPIPFSHAELIKKDSIRAIIRDGHESTGDYAYGTLIGAAVGAGLLGITLNSLSGSGLFSPQDISTAARLLIIGGGAFVGFIIGAIVYSSNSDSEHPAKSLLLSSEKDREFLRSISLYPDKEPEEMKYIK